MGRKNRGNSKFWLHKKIFPPGAKGKKNNIDIPTPLMAVIDHIHESCSTGRTYQLNSVTTTKYTGSGTRYPESSDNDPNINPDSNIFTISLGDSCPVTFRDKCT